MHFAVNPSLRGEMLVKLRRLMAAQGGRDGRSLCASHTTNIVAEMITQLIRFEPEICICN